MIVLVHGVPETAALWDRFRGELGMESVALSLPGFGCARPEGFGATKDEYVAWLIRQLDEIGGRIDLVGHDWGAALTCRIATAHGGLLRSWVVDSASGQHPDHVWHDLAKIWQTPGEGEASFTQLMEAPVESVAGVFESMGVPHSDAVAMVGAVDSTMASCILDLYRSAMPNNFATWGAALKPTIAPGLVLFADQDPHVSKDLSFEVAAMLGAQVETLSGLGHWWALQSPSSTAKVVSEFIEHTR